MDLKKLSLGDQIIGGSGIVLFIVSFFTWFKVEVQGFGGLGGAGSANAWDLGFLVGPFPVLIGLLMAAYVGVHNFAPQVKLPEAPYGLILFIAGCVAAALVVLKLLIGEGDGGLGDIVEVKRGFGIFLGALAAIGLAVGGYFKWKEPTTPSAPPTAF